MRGYRTGMFDKWHLGTLTTTVTDANRGRPGNTADFAPPWLRGFDVCFATESKVPTYHPMVRPRDFTDHPGKLKDWWDPDIPPENRQHFGTRYWEGQGREVAEDLDGPNSRVIMDRAIPFIRSAAEAGEPFLAVIGFHEPHLPVVAGPEDSAAFAGLDPFARHYHGCITAADREVGRLRAELRRLAFQWELYDLIEDPAESRDLAAEMPEKVAAMAAEIDRWPASVEGCIRRAGESAAP